jgi:4-hydroxy-tetrahydrodipicolinate synthase
MSISRIGGIIPPIVTPFQQDGSLDESLHRQEVRYMVEKAKVHGLAICGSTGEGHTLNTAESRLLMEWTAEEVQGRIPVIASIITNSTTAAVERALAIKDLSPAALQCTPVHYLFRPDDEAMLRYFGDIADRSGIPVIIYNVVPWAYLSPTLLVRIMREVPGVVGVKQSANDMQAVADLLFLIREAGLEDSVRIITAVDSLLFSSFQLGAHGAIAAILSAVPEWCVALWDAVQEGDLEQAQRLHDSLLQLWHALSAPNLPANVREAMKLRGRNGGYPRAPMPVSSPEQAERVRSALTLAEEGLS